MNVDARGGHDNALLVRAGELAACLRRAGLSLEPDLDSLREYSLRVVFRRGDRECGRGTIYFKPTRATFSFRADGLRDARLAGVVEKAWGEIARPADAGRPLPAGAAGDIGAPPGTHLYVDGSYLDGRIGYGAVVIRDGRVAAEICGRLDRGEAGASRQVAGEIRAVEKAIAWCQANGIGEVFIHYDYRGLENWVSGAYRSNLALTRNYRDFVIKSGVRIHWRKVKSHSGDRWNDAADRLARRGAGEQGAEKPGAGLPDAAARAGEKARAFARFLEELGIPASFLGVFNDQYARLEFRRAGARAGFFDLYNTARKPFSPYLHGFADAAFRAEIVAAWAKFSG